MYCRQLRHGWTCQNFSDGAEHAQLATSPSLVDKTDIPRGEAWGLWRHHRERESKEWKYGRGEMVL